ncbi:hypothetical protein [uncultured Desulfovibrio sp.]|uniref:Uncharacterized protein n=1 Tax=Candidatus Desulfovibrio intestinavium TaxID=2838534 RepID=A0A9D2HMG8_9BACT|nr:hypothetical protein [uncultured Desulfovibrio sp.]HJA78892.1 hypothetical protein [Candidatus Desulfovibrio intestinavium]
MSEQPLSAPVSPDLPASGGDMPLPPFLPGADDAAVGGTPQGAPASPSPDAPDAAPSPNAREDAQEAIFRQRLAAHADTQRQDWLRQVDQWRRDVAADPELGGDNLAASVARAQLALDRFDADGQIGRLLEQSGYGNHPAIIRFFNRMADGLMEDSLPQSRPDQPLQPLEERMYAGWSSRP